MIFQIGCPNIYRPSADPYFPFIGNNGVGRMTHLFEIITGGLAVGLSRLVAVAVYDLGRRFWVRVIRPRLRKPDRR